MKDRQLERGLTAAAFVMAGLLCAALHWDGALLVFALASIVYAVMAV